MTGSIRNGRFERTALTIFHPDERKPLPSRQVFSNSAPVEERLRYARTNRAQRGKNVHRWSSWRLFTRRDACFRREAPSRIHEHAGADGWVKTCRWIACVAQFPVGNGPETDRFRRRADFMPALAAAPASSMRNRLPSRIIKAVAGAFVAITKRKSPPPRLRFRGWSGVFEIAARAVFRWGKDAGSVGLGRELLGAQQ